MYDQEGYLTTGAFAKLCHTTKHTLFHYCDIGLFRPAYADANGYRYYHVLQYDTFMAITELRAIGMSLTEIGEYLAERSPKGMVALYERQEQLIYEKIAQLEGIKDRICRQKEKIQQAIGCQKEYFWEEMERCPLACSPWITQRDDCAMTAAVGALENPDEKTTVHSGMLCRLSDAVTSENYPFRFYACGTSGKEDHVRQAGKYLCTYHYGTYETLWQTYQKLAACAKQQGLVLDAWLYAETILGDWAVRQPQEYIIKVYAKGNQTEEKEKNNEQSL